MPKHDPSLIGCPVVLACDAAYGMQLATTLRSILEANPRAWPLEFHVLSHGLLDGTRTKVLNSLPSGSASTHWIPVDPDLYKEFETAPHVSKMTYVRFLIPRLFPSTVSRVLYLDTDLLVLDDLRPLWETDLEGAVVGAVIDRWDLQIKRREAGLEDVPLVQNYFNAGVLLIDLPRWRDERISEKAMEYMVEHPHSPFMDQDALNVACDGLWKRLDPRWNFHDPYGKKILEMAPGQRPGIIHFVGKEKPWCAGIPNVNARLYDAIRSRTCFARTPRDRVGDVFQHFWARIRSGWWHFKDILRQSAFLRGIEELIRRRKRI